MVNTCSHSCWLYVNTSHLEVLTQLHSGGSLNVSSDRLSHVSALSLSLSLSLDPIPHPPRLSLSYGL